MKPVKALGRGSVAAFVRGGLGVAWLLFWLVAIGIAVAAIGYAISLLMVATGGLDAQWLHERSQHIRLNNGRIDNYNGPDWVLVYATLIIAAVSTAGGLVIIFHLRKLFDSFLSSEPFRRENAYHLRIIWITMLVVEVSRIVLMGVAGVMIRVFGGPSVQGHSGGGPINLMTWASILILIVLAEVFREGARLKEEQELTI